jgi:DsbC/DsbD-like thiol-disulfide interchange protein
MSLIIYDVSVGKIAVFKCLTAVAVLAASTQTTAETKHLKLSASASADRVRPGQRVALTLDIELKPNMHVYAPSVEGYIPIEWSMAPNAAVVAQPMVTPAPQMLHLEALDETLPVYSGRFRLVRDIAIAEGAKAKGAVTIEGTFRYQACDDRMCYVPKTVPLKWTLQVQER